MASLGTRVRGIGVTAIALLLSTAVALGGAELVARHFLPHVRLAHPSGILERLRIGTDLLIRDDIPVRRYRPGARVVIVNHPLSRQDVDFEVNSLGFRYAELPRTKGDDELRILALGDSITAGDALPAEQGYVALLEARLHESHPDVSVINAGVSGIGLADELAILREPGLALEPDLVMLGFYLNDAHPTFHLQGVPSVLRSLRRYSALIDHGLTRWTLHQADRRFRGRPSPFAWLEAQHTLSWQTNPSDFLALAGMAEADWGGAWGDEDWVTIEQHLSELRRLAGAQGFGILVVAFPVAFQVYAQVPDETPQRRLAALAERLTLLYVDLLPELRRHNDQELFYDHCHLNALGNRVVAEAIGGHLEELVARREGRRS